MRRGGGSSTPIPSSNIGSDSLLSSFTFNARSASESAIPITEGDLVPKFSPKVTPLQGIIISYHTPEEIHCFGLFPHSPLFFSFLNSEIRQVALSTDDQEMVRKSKFVQGLLWSTMLENKFCSLTKEFIW